MTLEKISMRTKIIRAILAMMILDYIFPIRVL
jgi:hypothetical protein